MREALVLLGRLDPDAVGPHPRVAQTHEPHPDRAATYAALVERFAGFHAATRSWYRT